MKVQYIIQELSTSMVCRKMRGCIMQRVGDVASPDSFSFIHQSALCFASSTTLIAHWTCHEIFITLTPRSLLLARVPVRIWIVIRAGVSHYWPVADSISVIQIFHIIEKRLFGKFRTSSVIVRPTPGTYKTIKGLYLTYG